MENNLKKIVFDNYRITIKTVKVLAGGWMNEKYLCEDLDNKKYVVKLFSSKKVEKMSKGEFSSDYLENQLANNLRIENYMHSKNLNCERISIAKGNRILLPYRDYQMAIISYLSGNHVSIENINNIQLYNLGQECAKMHFLFKNVDATPYVGNYLKIPSLEELFDRHENKMEGCSNNATQQYLDLLIKQKENLLLIKKANIIDEIPIAVTHGDFADDNIIFDGNIPKILDFELVRLNSPFLDIGRIIMSYCYDNNRLDYDRIKSFMSGYNNILKIKDTDIFLSLVTVWINEVDMWIKENYFIKKITKKSKRFQEELIYLTYNISNIIQHYINNKSLINFCTGYDKKRRLLR